jgi:hypothetical protein
MNGITGISFALNFFLGQRNAGKVVAYRRYARQECKKSGPRGQFVQRMVHWAHRDSVSSCQCSCDEASALDPAWTASPGAGRILPVKRWECHLVICVTVAAPPLNTSRMSIALNVETVSLFNTVYLSVFSPTPSPCSFLFYLLILPLLYALHPHFAAVSGCG